MSHLRGLTFPSDPSHTDSAGRCPLRRFRSWWLQVPAHPGHRTHDGALLIGANLHATGPSVTFTNEHAYDLRRESPAGTCSRRRRSKSSPGISQAHVPPRRGNSGKQPGTFLAHRRCKRVCGGRNAETLRSKTERGGTRIIVAPKCHLNDGVPYDDSTTTFGSG